MDHGSDTASDVSVCVDQIPSYMRSVARKQIPVLHTRRASRSAVMKEIPQQKLQKLLASGVDQYSAAVGRVLAPMRSHHSVREDFDLSQVDISQSAAIPVPTAAGVPKVEHLLNERFLENAQFRDISHSMCFIHNIVPQQSEPSEPNRGTGQQHTLKTPKRTLKHPEMHRVDFRPAATENKSGMYRVDAASSNATMRSSSSSSSRSKPLQLTPIRRAQTPQSGGSTYASGGRSKSATPLQHRDVYSPIEAVSHMRFTLSQSEADTVMVTPSPHQIVTPARLQSDGATGVTPVAVTPMTVTPPRHQDDGAATVTFGVTPVAVTPMAATPVSASASASASVPTSIMKTSAMYSSISPARSVGRMSTVTLPSLQTEGWYTRRYRWKSQLRSQENAQQEGHDQPAEDTQAQLEPSGQHSQQHQQSTQSEQEWLQHAQAAMLQSEQRVLQVLDVTRRTMVALSDVIRNADDEEWMLQSPVHSPDADIQDDENHNDRHDDEADSDASANAKEPIESSASSEAKQSLHEVPAPDGVVHLADVGQMSCPQGLLDLSMETVQSMEEPVSPVLQSKQADSDETGVNSVLVLQSEQVSSDETQANSVPRLQSKRLNSVHVYPTETEQRRLGADEQTLVLQSELLPSQQQDNTISLLGAAATVTADGVDNAQLAMHDWDEDSALCVSPDSETRALSPIQQDNDAQHNHGHNDRDRSDSVFKPAVWQTPSQVQRLRSVLRTRHTATAQSVSDSAEQQHDSGVTAAEALPLGEAL